MGKLSKLFTDLFCKSSARWTNLSVFLFTLMILLISCDKEIISGPEEISSGKDELSGRWEWTGSCGGFTGGCWYPNENHRQQIEFKFGHIYIRTVNGVKTQQTEYSLAISYDGTGKYYTITFGDGRKTHCWFSGKDTLNIVGGDFVETFKRIR